jgi:hypothetical protein
MAGITHGLLTGVLAVSGLAYLTAGQFEKNALRIHNEIATTVDIYEKRNEPTPHISNVRTFYTSSVSEGAKDIWNEEVIRAINWWYDVKLGNRIIALITDAFN